MRAIAVTGEVDRNDLGFALPHEHLHCTSSFLCQGDSNDVRPVSMIPDALLRTRPMDFASNLDLRDEPTAREELLAYARAGGGTLVELTTPDLGRDSGVLRRLSEASGVTVVMGTGYYVDATLPATIADASIFEIQRHLVVDIIDGDPATGVRAGIIGEIGTSDPLTPNEEKVLRAAARAHTDTGCPINVHLAAGCREVNRVLTILADENIRDLSRVVISHMDVAPDLDQQRAVAECGAYVEYDTFGHERYPDSRGNVMPTDEQRVRNLVMMERWGLLERVLISHDVCMRSLWHRCGGKGYDNLLGPARVLMEGAGFGETQLRLLSIENPGRLLAFVA
jgi:phosphotriesterase-related protein